MTAGPAKAATWERSLPTETVGEPGAKELPEAVKLYLINQDDFGFGGM